MVDNIMLYEAVLQIIVVFGIMSLFYMLQSTS